MPIKKRRKKREIRTTWSNDMLKEFLDPFNDFGIPTPLSFAIKERLTCVEINEDGSTMDTTYIGNLLTESEELQDVHFALNCEKECIEDIQHPIGFIELLNGIYSYEDERVPAIRAFIKTDTGLFEFVNKMLIETKILNPKMLVFLNINLDLEIVLDIVNIKKENNPAIILNKKLFIKDVETHQRLILA